MQMIAELGIEEKPVKSSKKGEPEDLFGKDDEDWEVYRGINKNTLSDEEEEDQ
jgi:actin-related protein 5